MFLVFAAADKGSKITRLTLDDLTFDRSSGSFAISRSIANHIRTRNQRLAGLHTLFDYIATRSRRCSTSASGSPPSR